MDEKYFVARVTTDIVDENTGKVKKNIMHKKRDT